ncbi:hypothetical protein HCA63_17090 [Listeria booriae]|uniref:hypothetical protein n=1 Tax=Listeria booriae TaxID=1552123 RepID=UPI001624383D|nr:hypothetical protein [Listeria booriae]MBC1890075.1 hypothetical protein [Listeria booriae]
MMKYSTDELLLMAMYYKEEQPQTKAEWEQLIVPKMPLVEEKEIREVMQSLHNKIQQLSASELATIPDLAVQNDLSLSLE